MATEIINYATDEMSMHATPTYCIYLIKWAQPKAPKIRRP